jgi:hypothetical protein
MAWSRTERVVLAGLIGSGAVLHLSHSSSVPNIPVGYLLEIVSKQKCSVEVVNMQYARVSTADGGGKLLPSATYHVMLGRTPSDTVHYAQLLSEKLCGEDGFELKFVENSVLGEAFANGSSILKILHLRSSQFIAEKYATLA